jgi:nucleoside-diphosphate-sugar epimerase
MTRPAPAAPRRVLITGASGFIGRALVQRFAELGSEVVGVDLVADPAAGIVAGSTLQPSAWAQQLAGADLVIHTAAIVSNTAPRTQVWRVNVLGTQRVLQAAVAAGVRRFVFLSSITVWGDDFPDGVTESDPPVIQGRPYADSKIAGEAVVLAAHAAGLIDVTVVRPGDVYGPGSRPWVLIPLAVIRAGRAVLPDGGRGIFTPVYFDDLVDGVVLAACLDAGRGHVFTITAGHGVSNAEYFGRLAAMVGGRVRTVPRGAGIALVAAVGAAERALGRPSELSTATARMMLRRGTYSIAKAQRTLGYQPAVDLDTGMARTRDWLVSQGLA